MKTRIAHRLTLLISLFILQPSSFNLAQGPLTPPGAPAPTMKTLDQVEPRINIQRTIDPLPSDADYHYIISAPGSYYLSSNLGITKPNGIHVTVAGVTIDLQGFRISRSSGTGGEGIVIDPTADRCVVKNGSFSGLGNAVRCVQLFSTVSRGGAFLQLSVSECSYQQILFGGKGWQIDGCKAYNNSGSAISARDASVISNCTVTDNHGAFNGVFAIGASRGSTLINCTATNNTFTYTFLAAAGSSLINCTAIANQTEWGFLLQNGSTATNCAASFNTSAAATSGGIRAESGAALIGCAAYSNLSTAPASITTGMGIEAAIGVTIKDCTATYNKAVGIRVNGSCVVTGCNASQNGAGAPFGDGIRTTGDNNRIDSNHAVGNSQWGIRSSTTNYITRNTATGNATANYNPDTGANFGPLSTIQTATSPWANF